LALAVVRDLRVARAPATPEDLEALETDVLAGFVLARAAAGLSDGTISSDVVHLEQVRSWFGRPLWEMEPADADVYFGKVLRGTAKGTRLSRAQALKTFFLFLELRHKVEIHQMTGHVVECPIDEVNRPRGHQQAKLRIPPSADQVTRLFTGWRQELSTCRKFAPAARNYTASRLMADVGLRVNETCKLDLPDIKWDLARASLSTCATRSPAWTPPTWSWPRPPSATSTFSSAWTCFSMTGGPRSRTGSPASSTASLPGSAETLRCGCGSCMTAGPATRPKLRQLSGAT
jgi:hypothetical protein